MRERIKVHTDLEVYRLAFEAAMAIFELSKGFPKFALACGYLSPERIRSLAETYDRVIGKLVTMILHPDQWQVPR